MNKTELKNFAVSARRELLEKVALRAKIFGIDKNSNLNMEDQFGQVIINGIGYPIHMKSAFQSLASQLKIKGYEQLLEEVAYTWFNRIIAIRYMEVHEYLPSRVNILSSKTGKAEPDILTLFETIDLNIDVSPIKDFIHQGKTEEAYRKLFIAQCNALNKVLPFLFEKINDYTELLLPDFLLDSESVISKLTKNEVLTESFQEVEVIGWLYQFYNSEPKDKVFTNLKKNKKIEKYDIPAATQLFTPKWIVQYMVENSLGQLWLETNPKSIIKNEMEYYIKQPTQEEDILEDIEHKNINIEEIKIFDPCVGSGHILVYAFDLLYRMYEETGYPTSEIPRLIIEKNLFGLDIDERATQLATFALLMKAREKSRRIFKDRIKTNILAIKESNIIDRKVMTNVLGQNDGEKNELNTILDTFIDAKIYGSILQPINVDYDKYLLRIETLDETQLTIENFIAFNQLDDVSALLHQAKILTDRYDLVITNPPYMSSKGMNIKLSTYIKKYFSNFKSDLFSTFIARTSLLLKPNGFKSMITMQSWLFLSSHEKLRQYILTNEVFYNLIQIGYNSFPEMNSQVAHAASFITRNYKNNNYKGTFINLNNEPITADKGKVLKKRIDEQDFYYKSTSDFKKLPRMIIGYWLSEKMSQIFTKYPTIGEISDIKQGMTTSDNDRFLRLWFEVNKETIGFGIPNREKAKQTNFKWFPYNKGGPFRKWYGNNEYIVNFQNDGEELRSFHDVLNKTNPGGRIKNQDFYFLEGITYTFLSSRIGVRYSPEGSIFDVAGSSMFPNKSDLLYLLGYLCSNLTVELLKVINPTINIQVGDIRVLPVKIIEDKNKLNELVSNCIKISKNDWDSHEKSWEFKTHPLIKFKCGLSLNKAYKLFEDYSHSQIEHLLLYEKEINEIFNKMFDVEDEIPSVVPRDEVRLIIPSRYDCTTSLLSYFIGCLMGRYTLDCEGLTFAGGEWDETKYKTFIPNKYGLIQFTDEHYFEEDIIVRLREFLTLIFGSEIVDENIQWLAESLELKRSESAEERIRRYFLDEFFIDHCQVYQKRPIYWLVDSGKQKGLRTLIYMHRYQPDTMATIRFEHLQEIQAKYHYEISDVDARIVNPNLSATEKRDLEKRKTDFQKRLDELLEFDKKLAEYANAQISIDFDDGVNVNYQKFDKVLAKIK